MAQGRCSAVLAVALLVVSAAMAVQGVDHVVGGATGWTKPNGNSIPDNYLSAWAKDITFTEGDNLIFNYNRAAHNVLRVTEADYSSCILTTPREKWATGSDTVKLDPGMNFFLCGTPSHCDSGQKITITAVNATGGSTTPSGNGASRNTVSVFQALVASTMALVVTFALW